VATSPAPTGEEVSLGARGSRNVVRGLTAAAVVLAIALVAVTMFGAGGGYRVTVELPNAGQLVAGNQVKVGGVPVGLVEEIELTGDGRARLELSVHDDDLTPLHEGTVAIVRATSLSGIANRYVALQPGPNNAPEIPDGGAIPAEDVRDIVELDQVINALDASTQEDLRRVTHLSAELFDDEAAKHVNAALEYLNPALSQTAATASELVADQRALERIVVESADVVGAVASRPADLDELVANALDAVRGVAARSADLESMLAQLPPVLRQTNTTLVNVRGLLDDLAPVVDEARPSAPDLARVLMRLRPITRAALPEARAVQAAIDRPGRADDLLGVLRRLRPLEDAALPAFASAVDTVEDALPVVREARPYTPDVVGGLINGFGGATSGYYDANGHYTRISFQGSPWTLTHEGTLLLGTDALPSLTGNRKGVIKRCPGASTQPAPDRSNPFSEGLDDICAKEAAP